VESKLLYVNKKPLGIVITFGKVITIPNGFFIPIIT